MSDTDSERECRRPKSEIDRVVTAQKMLAKRGSITMKRGRKPVFNDGMLPVETLAAAIAS